MAFNRPTLKEIIARVTADVKDELNLATIIKHSFLNAIIKAVSGLSHMLHAHLVFISRQIFPDQAEAEYVDRWGSIYGLERNPATFAQVKLDVVFSSVATLLAGTVWIRDDGAEYTVDTEVTSSGAETKSVDVTAAVAGADYNLTTSDKLTLQSAVAGINSEADVTTITTEAADGESDASYQQRIVDRIQNPPAGGTVNDYKQFVLSVSGVTRAWVFPGYRGEGTVDVSFVQDNETPIIPQQPKIDEVQDVVTEKKPVTADAVVFAPVANVIDFTIKIKPNIQSVRDAVEASLLDLFISESEIKGAYKTVTTTYDGKIPISRVNEAVSLADGEEDHVIVTPTVSPEPAATGGIVTLGTITFETLA